MWTRVLRAQMMRIYVAGSLLLEYFRLHTCRGSHRLACRHSCCEELVVKSLSCVVTAGSWSKPKQQTALRCHVLPSRMYVFVRQLEGGTANVLNTCRRNSVTQETVCDGVTAQLKQLHYGPT
eukprot:gnl/TRDRNA2_/TRDRNA2_145903_c2_seq1.p1 gnl/TRDRNA2_/TRDRNA2_145903_c2~~gnl/TRDRNA2_/TRDRNA2_145903_c2_seq1.p1  ORF type:complete len:122 (+),score=6.76 gnl/TRDRNA2_/TRDRNA2_145903_c2_seq1:155-520(+)